MGAGSYVSCMGVAAVIMVAPGGVVQLQAGPFLRDATALLVGLLVATTASMDDAVTTDVRAGSPEPRDPSCFHGRQQYLP